MEMHAAPSRRSSLGVEWELATLDAATLDLAPLAHDALEDVHAGLVRDGRGEDTIHVVGEFMLNNLELTTGVCTSVAEATGQLDDLLGRTRRAAAARGGAITSFGLHPFADWSTQAVGGGERYRRLIERAGTWAQRLSIWGVHVHVGVEHQDDMLPMLEAMLTVAPLVQAISAASPVSDGEDTGYASQRTMLFQQLPTAAAPPEFHSWSEFETCVQDLLDCGAIAAPQELRWDIRPVPAFGTIELRVADGVPSLAEVAAIAALTQCAMDDLAERLARDQPLPHLPRHLVAENKWRAARYGTAAVLIDAFSEPARPPALRPVPDVAARTVARLRPTAERLGCTAELESVLPLARACSAADRMRTVAGLAPDARHALRSGLTLTPEQTRSIVHHCVTETEAGTPLPAAAPRP